jgi:hypothetical protein
MRHFDDEDHPSYLDLAAFDFTSPCQDLPELKERFFDLRNIPPDAPNADIIIGFVAGFPSQDQKYELEEKNHIGKQKRVVLCELDPSPYDPALLCLRTNEPLGFDPDGMSGGSAFVVQRVGGQLHAFFAGMIVTGGTDRFHIIKVGDIERFLQAIIARKGPPKDGKVGTTG